MLAIATAGRLPKLWSVPLKAELCSCAFRQGRSWRNWLGNLEEKDLIPNRVGK